METDWVQHILWGKKDQCLLPVYVKIDGMIGHFMEVLKEEDVIIILSDHGFGPIRKTFYLNAWLREKGFLVSKRQWGYSKDNLDAGIFHHSRGSSWVNKIKRALSKRNTVTDWKKTQAYFDNTGSTYGIQINLMGREPEGIVRPEKYDEVRNRIIEELNSVIDGQEGKKVIERIYRREDVYWGPYTKNASDIIFKKNKEGGSFHRLDGVLILHGPGIKKGKKIVEAHIMDVAPTILYLLDLPVPKGFDGKVLTEAQDLDILKTSPVRIEDIPLEVEVPGFVMTETEEGGGKKSSKGARVH